MRTLEKHISELPNIAPRAGLSERVTAAIFAARERARRLRERLFGAAAVISAALTGTALWYAVEEVSRSTFGSYASLLFTDTGIALANWKVFALSLAESAPIGGAALFLGALFLFMMSVKAFAAYLPKHTVYQIS